MKLSRVDFVQAVPRPGSSGDYVDSLQVSVASLKTHVDALELRDGIVWAGLTGYPLAVVARLEQQELPLEEAEAKAPAPDSDPPPSANDTAVVLPGPLPAPMPEPKPARKVRQRRKP